MLLGLKRKIILKFLDGYLREEVKNMKMPTKTTLAGIFAILGTVAHVGTSLIAGQPVDWSTAIAGIMAGLGLIHAKTGSSKE